MTKGGAPFVNECVDVANLLVHVGNVNDIDIVNASLLSTLSHISIPHVQKLCGQATILILCHLETARKSHYARNELRNLCVPSRIVLLGFLAHGAERIASRDTDMTVKDIHHWLKTTKPIVHAIGPANVNLYNHYNQHVCMIMEDKLE